MENGSCSLPWLPGWLPSGPRVRPFGRGKQADGAQELLRLRHTYRSAAAARTSATQPPVAAPTAALALAGLASAGKF